MRITINETCGLIIDIQEKLIPHIHNSELFITNTRKLIAGLKILEVPILVTQQYTKGLGATVAPVANALGDYFAIEKAAFSCADDTLFMSHLQKLNKRFVVIAGIEAHVCVLQTTIDLLEKGYIPVIVQDCISSRTLENKLTAMDRFRKEGAIITSYESILFELLRYSGTDKFREISRLVK